MLYLHITPDPNMNAKQQSYSHHLLLLMPCLGLLVFFMSCTKPDERKFVPHPALAEIDSLLWSHPDSAFVELQRFAESPDADSLEVCDGHYFQLLLSELLYKNDYAQTNREELLKAVGYFDSLVMADAHGAYFKNARGASLQQGRNAFLDARCHYINGVGYFETDSIVRACQEYLKALETIETHFSNTMIMNRSLIPTHIPRFLALTYGRLGDLFSEQYLLESAMSCYENSLKYCEIEPTSTQGTSNLLYRIGKQHDMMDHPDKARQYYTLALEKTTDTNTVVYRNIVSSNAFCEYLVEKDAEVPLNTLKQILRCTDDDEERLRRFLTIGVVFAEEKLYDSALLYLRPVFESQSNINLQTISATYLKSIYDSIGDRTKSDDCSRFLANHKEDKGENNVLVSLLESTFQNHLNWRQERLLALQKRNSIRKTGILGFVLISVIAISIGFITKTRNRKKLVKQQDDSLKELEAKTKQLEAEKEMRQRDKNNLQQLLLQKENQLIAMEKALNQQFSKAEQIRKDFLNEQICCKINNSIRDKSISARNSVLFNNRITDEDASALKSAVSKYYENLDTLLLSKNPKMSKEDMLLCYLYLLGLDERQISVLLCKSYSTIKKRAKILEERLGIEDDLPSFILELAGTSLGE